MKYSERCLLFINEALRYDEDSGKIFWREDRPASHFKTDAAYKQYLTSYARKEAGSLREGKRTKYRSIYIDYQHIKAHRIAYALLNAEWPKGDIDHINGDGADNRPCNLRVVDNKTNAKNTRMHKNNSSGVTGVHFDSRKLRWIAQGNEEGKRKQIGSFLSFEEAVENRKIWEATQGFSHRHGRE